MHAQDTYWMKACIQLGLPSYKSSKNMICVRSAAPGPCSHLVPSCQETGSASLRAVGGFSRFERKDEYPDNVAIAIEKTESNTIIIAQVRNPQYRSVWV